MDNSVCNDRIKNPNPHANLHIKARKPEKFQKYLTIDAGGIADPSLANGNLSSKVL